MKAVDTDSVILGAGIVGSGVALELARRGIGCTLVERDHQAINRASLRNEGKIHLGIIYANDASRKTAALQLRGALRFRSVLSSWLGSDNWMSTSTPFSYLVADDSILSVDQLSEHFAAVEELLAKELAVDPGLDYLGQHPEQLTWRMSHHEVDPRLRSGRLQAMFGTAELAIDTERMAIAIRDAIRTSPLIAPRYNHTVRSLERVGDRFVIGGDGPDGPWQIRCTQVVNATWEQRSKLDAELGLSAPTNLLHRLKYRVIAELPEDMADAPSVTMVLGPYGDVVVRPDRTAYLSWYPVGLQGWSNHLSPPSTWDAPSKGHVDPTTLKQIACGILEGIQPWFSGINRARPKLVDAGAIVAYGTTDVDDASSGLHDRSNVGVQSHGGYHTVDGGKLTSGPIFALETVDRIVDHDF